MAAKVVTIENVRQKSMDGHEEDLWTSQAPLTNAQFRQLAETPVHKRKAKLGKYYPVKHKEFGKKSKQETIVKEETKAEGEDDLDTIIQELKEVEASAGGSSDQPLYRDRAKERREGRNEDAGKTPLLFSGSSELTVDPKTMTIEETKFLGGDIDHTYLVKGLDYALLNKERARLKKEETESAKKEEEIQKQRQSKRGISFKTPMGKAVYMALFKAGKAETSAKFQPSRTAFLFNLEDEKALGYRPTVLQRPKSEHEKQKSSVMASVDSKALQTISTVLGYILSSPSGEPEKKEKRGEKHKLLEAMLGPLPHEKPKSHTSAAETALRAPAITAQKYIPEDDIFADAGTDYKCSVTRKKKKKIETMAKPPQRPIESTPEVVTNCRKPWQQQVEMVDDDRELLKVDQKTERSIDPTALPDHYAECYPGFHQSYSATMIDSDDEDFSHMDAKGKGASRCSFETDEDWSKYKQSLEKLPKAAFQYGVKMTDGRKAQSKLADKHRKEQKLDSQLNKIERIFKDQGRGHEGAFHSDKPSHDTAKDDASIPSLPTPKNRKRIRLADN